MDSELNAMGPHRRHKIEVHVKKIFLERKYGNLLQKFQQSVLDVLRSSWGAATNSMLSNLVIAVTNCL